MAVKGSNCELCDSEAKTFCESDQAMLCWECDDKVHSANFLVEKHTRTALCRVCHSLTPWKASGVKLGRIVTVCDDCVARSNAVGGGSAESLSGEELDDDCCDYDDDDSSSDDDENQVVPWTSTPPPAASTSGSEEEESSGDAVSESTNLFNVEIGANRSASSSMEGRSSPPDDVVRPLKQRKIAIQMRKHN